jgi:hypothetical protein
MKSLSKIILVASFVVAFSACSKKDDVSVGDSSVSSAGVISGTISNYTSGSVDSIVAFYGGKDAKSTVSTNGQFSLTVSVPNLSTVGSSSISGVTVSDANAKTGSVLFFYTYKNGNLSGLLTKSNYSVTSSNESETAAGESVSSFVYCDRDLTIKGTGTETESSTGVTVVISFTYDVTYKKGWNETVTTINAYSETATGGTESVTVTTTIPSGMTWSALGSGLLDVRSNVDKIHSFLPIGLFR